MVHFPMGIKSLSSVSHVECHMDLSTVLGVALAWLFVGTAIYLGADGKAAALILSLIHI